MSFDSKYEKDLAYLYNEIQKYDSLEEFEKSIDDILKTVFGYMPDGDYKKKILTDLYEKNKTLNKKSISVDIYQEEIDFLKSIKNTKHKEYMFCLMVYKKIIKEKRDFVQFDFDQIFSILYDHKKLSLLKRENLVPLSQYGVEFRAVGKKKVKACYKIPVFVTENLVATLTGKQEIRDFYEKTIQQKKNM